MIGQERLEFLFFSWVSHDQVIDMPYELELISIRCNDAQEWFDEAYLLVNGSRIWRYPAMQTGLTYPFGGGSGARVSFEGALSLELWEEDQHTSDDRIGSLMLSEHLIQEMIHIDPPPVSLHL
jgi:hypothetical protein